ncbi:MAG: hypothetical protein U0821_18575 [Chloroflexota bacterium]
MADESRLGLEPMPTAAPDWLRRLFGVRPPVYGAVPAGLGVLSEQDQQQQAQGVEIGTQRAVAAAQSAADAVAARKRSEDRAEAQADADLEQTRAQARHAAALAKKLDGELPDAERIRLEQEARLVLEEVQQGGRLAVEAFRQTFEREIRVWDAAQRAAEAKGQRDWQSIENEKDRLARASESDKSIAAQERISDKRMAFDAEQGAANRSVTARGQDLQAMAGKDSWVLGLIKAQVDSGQLSLDQATKKFSAYIERAKLPTQIMENISNAMQPFVPYMTNRQAGEFAPGFEPGGPMEKLVQASGATYDPSKYAVNPVKVDLFGLAKKAGADFSQSGKLPDPDKMFNVKVPSIDPNMRSNLDAFMERESAGNESADGGGGVLASLTARPEPSMVSPDEKADLERYVSNLR